MEVVQTKEIQAGTIQTEAMQIGTMQTKAAQTGAMQTKEIQTGTMQTKVVPTEEQKPQFDVILRFEQQAEDFFHELIGKLALVTGNTTRLCNGQPPHVSMGIFDIVDSSDPVRVMENVLRSLKPFPMTFDALGVFLPGTLIVAPVMTDEMIAMNRAIHTVADQVFVPSRQYVYGTWVPHLTLAAELTHEELVQAFDVAGLEWKPVETRTVSISLVHHFPYTEELVVPLE